MDVRYIQEIESLCRNNFKKLITCVANNVSTEIQRNDILVCRKMFQYFRDIFFTYGTVVKVTIAEEVDLLLNS